MANKDEQKKRTYIKTFHVPLDRQDDLDKQVKEWIDETGSEVVDTKVATTAHGIVMTVIHYPGNKVPKPKMGPPVPLVAGAVAPTVPVTRIVNDDQRPAQAMAGVFGVPEGASLAIEDTELAPTPVFSPDFDVSKYSDFFGNVK